MSVHVARRDVVGSAAFSRTAGSGVVATALAYMVIDVFETVRYSHRLRPGRTAQAALLDEWGRCRWLWNEAVHQQKTGRKPTLGRLSKMLTDARGRNAWLRAGSQVAQQQSLRTYAIALDHSFKVKGRGRPKVKRLKDAPVSLEYTTRGFRIKAGVLCLPGRVTVPVVWSRDLPSEPTSVRVYRDNLGHWYASFVVRRDRADTPEAMQPAEIPLDSSSSTTSPRGIRQPIASPRTAMAPSRTAPRSRPPRWSCARAARPRDASCRPDRGPRTRRRASPSRRGPRSRVDWSPPG
ncbi:hypothetical protein [Catellatospora sichuanensis]|uniref:hypothetical protein n=1 Tax=Catellatospora sichuanensis TaxID=1969805 RepID=UPI001642CAAD|nr:hypothetical protein [Catellatospora sichuanensis]